jgi:3-oxoacyl-[acyl-carrier-protein] synthase-3
VATGDYKTVLLIGAEALSRFVDWSDRNTCVLFGDGAGAVVLQPVEKGYGVLSSHLAADGSGADLLKIPAGGAMIPGDENSVANRLHSIQMNGNEVFKFAVRALPKVAKRALHKFGLTVADVDYLIPHQANQRIIDTAAQRLKISPQKVVSNISKYGNTSTASIPLALDELWQMGKLKKGDVLLFVGFGGGLTWGANVVRWSRSLSSRRGKST